MQVKAPTTELELIQTSSSVVNSCNLAQFQLFFPCVE